MVNDKVNNWCAAGFLEFIARTTEYAVLTDWFEKNVAQQENIKSMLSVGFGSGFDLKLACKIRSLSHLTAIDPNIPHLDDNELKESTNLEIKYQCTTFENFSVSRAYDIILFSHSLYYINDPATALKKAKCMLSPNGFVLIFHQLSHGINAMQRKFNPNKFTYCLKDLEKDLKIANLVYSKTIIDSVVDITEPTKNLCNFFLEKELSEEEFMVFTKYLKEIGNILYHPSSIVRVHKELNESSTNIIDILRNKLLENAEKSILSIKELTQIGEVVYGSGEAASLYGRTPKQLEEEDLKVHSRTGVEAVYDPFAIPFANHTYQIIKSKYTYDSIVVIDPFLGSGNQLYHFARITKAAAAFGFDSNAHICAQTARNFEKLNFRATVTCADYITVSKLVKLNRNEKQLVLINLSPSWTDAFSDCTGLKLSKASPPFKSLIKFYQEQFSDHTTVFVITIPERIEGHSMKELFDYSLFYEIFSMRLSEHNSSLGILVLEPKVVEYVGRQLTFQAYPAASDEFRSRFSWYDLIRTWFLSYVKDTRVTVKKILCVGAGPAALEAMLANKLPDLTTFHCVEPNIRFIPALRENFNRISVNDKEIFLLPFEDFHYNGRLYDIILISPSLYYMDNKMQQLAKAQQSLLTNNGSIIIFHETVHKGLTEIQKLFSVKSTNHNNKDLENDFSCCAIKYTVWPPQTRTNITSLTENLFKLSLERYANVSKKEQLEYYIREDGDILATPEPVIVLKSSST